MFVGLGLPPKIGRSSLARVTRAFLSALLRGGCLLFRFLWVFYGFS